MFSYSVWFSLSSVGCNILRCRILFISTQSAVVQCDNEDEHMWARAPSTEVIKKKKELIIHKSMVIIIIKHPYGTTVTLSVLKVRSRRNCLYLLLSSFLILIQIQEIFWWVESNRYQSSQRPDWYWYHTQYNDSQKRLIGSVPILSEIDTLKKYFYKSSSP